MKLQKIKETLNGKLAAVSMAASTMIAPIQASALQAWNGGVSGDQVVKGFATTMARLATYGGGMYAIGAAFALVLSIRNEDTEGRNKAILNLLAAIGLVSFGFILDMFGIAHN